jgi:ribosomal protein S18 acetylase RimI-like enzyme
MADPLDPLIVREQYDAQLRTWLPVLLPAGAVIELDGPLLRVEEMYGRGFVTYSSLGVISGADLDRLIARQRDHFAARGQAVEWKLHGHDEPADLADRLQAAGFEPENREAVVVGEAAPLADPHAPLPDGVRLMEVTDRADLDAIAVMESRVWGGDHSHRADVLEAELAANPAGTTIVVARAGDEVVGAGWVRYMTGTAFASLWGGSTLAPWRRRGIYSALVRYRAALAVERGYRYLQVDASDESRPILQRLGFIVVTTTTPFVHTPRPKDPATSR